MATLLEIWNLKSTSANLRNRCAAAVAKAAQDVLNEDAGTENHAARVVWAQDALVNAESAANRMMWGLLGNATIQSSGESSTDNDIQFVVNGLINTFATS